MRLTLRTLLAYLDDTLEPAQAKLIGQKVAESEAARELIERIKQVTRRRRLTAPPASGPGKAADANIVAEYLDSVLPADQLAEAEEHFLNSDVHLAEVASCHQILTLFLGQPAAVPPTAKQRMYALLKGRPGRSSPKPSSGAVADDGEEDAEEDDKLRLGLPFYRRVGGNRVRRLAPVIGAIALVAVLGIAITQLVTRGKARDTGAVAVVDTEKENGGPEPERIAPPVPPKNQEKLPAVPAPDPDPNPKPKTPEKVPLDKVPADVPSEEHREVGKYIAPKEGPASVLLQRSSTKEPWRRVKPGAVVATGDVLVSLPGYRTDLQLNAGARLVLWSNVPEFASLPLLESTVILHVPEGPFDVDVTLDHGRVVLANTKADGPLRVKVRFHNEVWDLTLRDGEAVVGLELWGGYLPGAPFRKKPGGEPPGAVLDLLGLAGETDVKIRYQKFTLGNPMYFHWNNTAANPRAPEKLPNGLPQWYTQPFPGTPAAKEMSVALENLSKQLGTNPIDVTLTEMSKDAKGAGAILSVLCLGATDDLPDLIERLGDERPEIRWAAVYTLTHWIGRNAEQDQKLYQTLGEKNGYSVVQAETVMFLLHGFSEEQANIPETYETLIDYLRSDKLAIRELAWRHLLRLWPEGRAIKYDPAAAADQRDRAYEEWKRKIPSGKLPPRPQPKP